MNRDRDFLFDIVELIETISRHRPDIVALTLLPESFYPRGRQVFPKYTPLDRKLQR